MPVPVPVTAVAIHSAFATRARARRLAIRSGAHPPSVIAQLQYVGSSGWDQNNGRQINTLPLYNDPSNKWSTSNPNPQSTTAGVVAQEPTSNPNWTPIYSDRWANQGGKILANKLRIFPGFAGINQEENETNSHYHSLQAGIRFENKHGFTSQLAYTFSHEIDTASNDLNGLPNPFFTGYNRGSGALDRRHIFNVSYVYNLPFAQHSSNAFARAVIAGWGISGITVFQTGTPMNIGYNGADTIGTTGTSNRPNLPGGTASISYPKTQKAWFNGATTGVYTDPVAPWFGGPNQGFGNAGKDNVRSPGLNNTNLTLIKNIPFTSHEGAGIELRFESFNTFNKTQFSGVDTNNHDGNFGQVTSIYTPRILELMGRFHF